MTRLLSLLTASLVLSGVFAGTSRHQDACAKIANQTLSSPADALDCYQSFPFNETLRDNGTLDNHVTYWERPLNT
jgi:hypothetical protein